MYILRKNFLSKVYPLRRVQIKVSQKPDYALKLQNCEGFLYGIKLDAKRRVYDKKINTTSQY